MNYLKKLKVKRYPTVRGIRKLKYFKYIFSRFKYGFDIRETWALYDSIDKLLYERLCAYREIAGDIIDLEAHKIEHKGDEYTLRQAIDIIIKRLEIEILADEPNVKIMKDVYEFYGKIRIYLWW